MLDVLTLTRPKGGWKGDFLNKAIVPGLVAGGLFGAASVGCRAATLAVGNEDALFRAVFSLAAVTTFQTLLLPWLIWFERGVMTKVAAARKPALWAGMTGIAAAVC